MRKAREIQTPIGPLFAVGSAKGLHYLGIDPVDAPSGRLDVLDQVEKELELYFAGGLKAFSTPLCFEGTLFQKQVWQELMQIPFGKTASYNDIGKRIQRPKASRAIGNANGKNPFIIIVPCHRIIHKDLSLGGYSAGLEKKKWLLTHEKVLWRGE